MLYNKLNNKSGNFFLIAGPCVVENEQMVIDIAGNVKDDGIRAIEKHGLFKLSGDKEIMQRMDELLESFIVQQRMKLPSDTAYRPCYEIVK